MRGNARIALETALYHLEGDVLSLQITVQPEHERVALARLNLELFLEIFSRFIEDFMNLAVKESRGVGVAPTASEAVLHLELHHVSEHGGYGHAAGKTRHFRRGNIE